MNSVIENIKSTPRVFLSNLNTPIEECSRINKIYPDGAKLFIKRDDFIGSLVWGNKLRKLEFAIADAIKEQADTIITCGGVQSNHARITAQICKRLGLNCELVHNGEEPDIPTGNHKVNRLLNISMHYVDSREERDYKMAEISQNLIEKGRRPYVIPLGASNDKGCLGFVEAINELKQQEKSLNIKFDYIVHATSSAGTQAGLELGKRIYGMEHIKIIGISADNSVDEIGDTILDCANPLSERLGITFRMSKTDFNIDTGFIGPGYGIASKESDEAIKFFSENEGIILDTTYTAKAAAGLLNYIRNGKFEKGKNVLFWHTGGLIGIL